MALLDDIRAMTVSEPSEQSVDLAYAITLCEMQKAAQLGLTQILVERAPHEHVKLAQCVAARFAEQTFWTLEEENNAWTISWAS